MIKKFLIAITLGLALCQPLYAYTSPGKPTGHINDFAGVLSSETKQTLEQELTTYTAEKSHEIAVVTIHTLDGDDIESYANTLFREWGIGKKDLNNGILFLIAVDDHKMRIEVGYGLEGAVTDTETKYIQDDVVRPYFKDGDYDKGVIEGVRKIEEAAADEIATESTTSSNSSDSGDSVFGWFWLVVFIFVFVIPWLASIFGRSKSWWAGGVVGGVVGLIGGLIVSFLWFLPIGIVIGLLFDYFVSKNYKAGKSSWWSGGSGDGWDNWTSSGSSGSSGGFGGFSGGSSGGGGSSSSW